MIKVSIEVKDQQLERVTFIQYVLKFKKDFIIVRGLIDSGNNANTMIVAYAAILRPRICTIDIEVLNNQ